MRTPPLGFVVDSVIVAMVTMVQPQPTIVKARPPPKIGAHEWDGPLPAAIPRRRSADHLIERINRLDPHRISCWRAQRQGHGVAWRQTKAHRQRSHREG